MRPILFGRKADFPDDARLLMPERVVPVCSPGFRARFGPFPDAEALARQPLLHLDMAGRPRWFTWTSWLAAQGVAREPAQGDLGLNTYGFVIQAATAEQGVALGWLGLVDAHLAQRHAGRGRAGGQARRLGLLADRQPARTMRRRKRWATGWSGNLQGTQTRLTRQASARRPPSRGGEGNVSALRGTTSSRARGAAGRGRRSRRRAARG